MSLKIIRPGLLTTLQDTGRYGYQKVGVITSGAMDVYSLRLANILVGNDENEAALEITLTGPTIEFTSDTLIAIIGGDFSPIIDGQKVPTLRPVAVKAGAILKFSSCKVGCRAYLAVAGGYDVPKVMGSKSTYLRANIGGFDGRVLKKGDLLNTNEPSEYGQQMMINLLSRGAHSYAHAKWCISKVHTSEKNLRKPIRVMAGLQYDSFSEKAKYDFFATDYLITTQSDRMGYRLEGAKLETNGHLEMISEVACSGTIQVPPNGLPIILMADHQTTAGYPVIGQIALVDVARIAQLKPGDSINFKLISNEEGERLFIAMEKCIENIKIAVAGKL